MRQIERVMGYSMHLPSAPARTRISTDLRQATGIHLDGPWLALARVVWIVVAVFVLMLMAVGAPAVFKYLQTVCTGADCSPQFSPQQVQELKGIGISLTFYAGYLLAFQLIFVIVWFVVAGVIFWRMWGKSDELLSWFVSLTLLTFGATFPNFISNATQEGIVWMLLAKVVAFLGVTSIVLLFYFFPTGRFVPRWTVILAILWGLWSLFWIIQNNPPKPSPLDVVYWPSYYILLAFGLFAQVYRYIRVSNPVQQQQTKWVIYGFTMAIAGFLVLNVIAGLSFFIPSLMSFWQHSPLLFFSFSRPIMCSCF